MIKKITSVIVIFAMALGFTSCRATERYERERAQQEANAPLICRKEFGSYRLNPGWIEAGSNEPDFYYYVPRGFENAGESPCIMYVSRSDNDYSEEENYRFCNDEYQNLCEMYPEGTVDIIMQGGINNNTACAFEITTENEHRYQWIILFDYEQITFELEVNDEELAEELEADVDVEDASVSFYR